MASSTGGINSEAKWFGSILEKASRSESKSVVTISVSRLAIFSVRNGTTPCQPNSPYGASSNRCKSSPRYSRGTNIIFTPIQFVTKPTPAATVGMRAYAPGLAATSWPIRVRRPAGCCAGVLKDARCRQPAARHRAPRCRIARDNMVEMMMVRALRCAALRANSRPVKIHRGEPGPVQYSLRCQVAPDDACNFV
jgi:hypothetical protein